MLIGYNTNVPYKGKNYHIQTEDSGTANPFIVTLLYHEGAILRSVRNGYSHIIGHPDFEKELRYLMKHQHREMIRELITGRCEKTQGEVKLETPSRPEGEKVMAPEKQESCKKKDKSLDEILLEHISKKVKR